MYEESEKAKKRALVFSVFVFIILSIFALFRFSSIVEPGMEWLYLIAIAIALILTIVIYLGNLRKIRITEENQQKTREEVYEREKGVLEKFVLFVVIMFILAYFVIFTYLSLDLKWIFLISLPGIFVILVVILSWRHNINKILYDDDFFELYYRKRRKL